MVVNVEQGATNPSVGTLLRISEALEVELPALVELPRPRPVTELWDWTMAPGDTHGSEAHSPGTKDLLPVQEGSISVVVTGEPFILGAGDAVSFPGDVEHSYGAVGKEPARFSLAVFEPGTRAGEPNSAKTTPRRCSSSTPSSP